MLTRPGINPYKQVELFKNYAKLMDEESAKITCPNPSEEVWDFVKAEKQNNKDRKIRKKEIMKNNRDILNLAAEL